MSFSSTRFDAALVPQGSVFIIGEVLDDSRLSPPQIAAANFAFANIYDEGRAFTEAEHRAWLAETGFTTFERRLLPSGESIIRTEKSVGKRRPTQEAAGQARRLDIVVTSHGLALPKWQNPRFGWNFMIQVLLRLFGANRVGGVWCAARRSGPNRCR